MTLGYEQAGFRTNHSTLDHIFSLHCIIDYFLSRKKKLFCLFIDYEKAFDNVNRAFLWQKLLNSGVNGAILRIIINIYERSKSCVKVDNNCSDYFQCFKGVRQGENLSPLLFAVYLNDLSDCLRSCTEVSGLSSLKQEAKNIGWDEREQETMFKMFLLLYADDTAVCAESEKQLQGALDAMSVYCRKWDLKLNVDKTKIIVFSRGKIRKIPNFKYRGRQVEVVYEYNYLGICMNYNNKFSVAQKQLYNKAARAMFSLITKCKKHMLPLDIRIELFDKMITPILLYGCEIWCPSMVNLASKLQLQYYKITLKVNRSTPNCMVYGDLGQYPLELQAKRRMLNYWFNLVNNTDQNKVSCTLYRFLHKQYIDGFYKSPYLSYIHNTLNSLGLSGLWIQQPHMHISSAWFNTKIKQCLKDLYTQTWFAEIEGKKIYSNYKIIKEKISMGKYIITLSEPLACSLAKFRMLSNKLPVQKGRITNIPYSERFCTLCEQNDIGDEFHYIFECPSTEIERKQYLRKYFHYRPNALKFHLLFNTNNKRELTQLAIFVKVVMSLL